LRILSTLPGRAHLQSADNEQYDVSQVSSSVGFRAFSIAGPQAQNHQMDRILTFKTRLKNELFTDAFCAF